MFSALKKEMALTESRKLGGPGLLYSWHLFNGVTFKYFFPPTSGIKNICSWGSHPHERFPIPGWMACRWGNIPHANVYVKTPDSHTVTVRTTTLVTNGKGERRKKRPKHRGISSGNHDSKEGRNEVKKKTKNKTLNNRRWWIILEEEQKQFWTSDFWPYWKLCSGTLNPSQKPILNFTLFQAVLSVEGPGNAWWSSSSTAVLRLPCPGCVKYHKYALC